MNTVLVEIINDKAYRLLEDLAALDVIKLHNLAPAQSNSPANKPEFGFAKNMIRGISNDFNKPLTEFSDYIL